MCGALKSSIHIVMGAHALKASIHIVKGAHDIKAFINMLKGAHALKASIDIANGAQALRAYSSTLFITGQFPMGHKNNLFDALLLAT